MQTPNKPGADPADKATAPAAGSQHAEAPVWVRVIKNGAVIGQAHHAHDKRMTLPLGKAELCASLGLVKIEGVA